NSIISEWSYYASEDKIVKDYVLEDGSYNWNLIQDQDNKVHGAYHGTKVAGVIAAQMNNGVGITGIAPDVELLVIKCKMNDDGTLNSEDCVFGLYYAIERDVDIVSISIGSSDELAWDNPVKLAYESDIICVASAGNSNNSTPMYPAACKKVIGVGALAENSYEKADYSNYGDWVDIFAPEVNWSTTNGGYDKFSGTSSSTPLVAGVLALYRSQNKYIEFDVLYETLIASTLDIGDLGKDFYYGWGALDVNALIWEEKGTVTFDYLTDEIEETTQIFVRNHTLQNIPEPERLYAAFDGWYYDIHCENEINYYEDIWNEDLTLYAKWINEDEGSPWIYTTLSDGTIELNSYTGKRRFITIPSKIEGKVVTSIGSNCFAYNSRIRQVTLPDSIKYIKTGAFQRCSYLLNITIPNNVISIGDSAFYECSRLSSVGIPTNGKLESIGTNAFSKCGRLERMDLPINLSSVDGSAFYGDTQMREITVAEGNSNFTICNGALYTFDKSQIVYLPSALTGTFEIDSSTSVIGTQAFSYSQMSEIIIPSSVITLNGEAFSYSSINSVYIPNSIGSVSDAYFNPGSLFKGCTNLQTVVFEDNSKLTKLGTYAFSGCNSLKSIDFGENSKISSIDNFAFSGCYSLKEIIIPSKVSTISSNAFSDSGLENVTFESDTILLEIYNDAFANCHSLTNISLPSSVNYIGDKAFSESGLDSFTVNENTTHLGEGVFAYCDNLTTLDVEEGNSVYSSTNNVIYYTNENNKKVLYCRATGIDDDFIVPNDVYIIDMYAFAGCNIKHVTLNEGLNEIKNNAFSMCNDLVEIVFPQSLETIGVKAFEYCTSIGDIVITRNIINLS
ncbi:MAG: leucine-rich repeat protein, partial [Erysipelotrichaceae bacterium]|nr:leucine-rich repeat protein [Erysipelotrichaceae bacterium]